MQRPKQNKKKEGKGGDRRVGLRSLSSLQKKGAYAWSPKKRQIPSHAEKNERKQSDLCNTYLVLA